MKKYEKVAGMSQTQRDLSSIIILKYKCLLGLILEHGASGRPAHRNAKESEKRFIKTCFFLK